MIVDTAGETVDIEVPTPAVGRIVDMLCLSDLRFEHDAEREGIDVRCLHYPEGGVPRARVKVFTPRQGTTVAFVYKDSQVPHSTDRFAYGALIIKNRLPTDEDLVGLIEYVASGLHPELRPRDLRRAFPFDVPR